MKILQVGTELLHADRHDEANGNFSQFYETAYKALLLCGIFVFYSTSEFRFYSDTYRKSAK